MANVLQKFKMLHFLESQRAVPILGIMKLLFIAALMIVWVSPLRSTPCKTVLRVKQEAMEYGE